MQIWSLPWPHAGWVPCWLTFLPACSFTHLRYSSEVSEQQRLPLAEVAASRALGNLGEESNPSFKIFSFCKHTALKQLFQKKVKVPWAEEHFYHDVIIYQGRREGETTLGTVSLFSAAALRFSIRWKTKQRSLIMTRKEDWITVDWCPWTPLAVRFTN